MKVRFGVGLARGASPAELPAIVDRLDAAGIDSLWFSELVYSTQVEPFVGMATALARTRALKVGTGVAILPGRHPALVAKQLASLAALARCPCSAWSLPTRPSASSSPFPTAAAGPSSMSR